jgi:hypothetical protein
MSTTEQATAPAVSAAARIDQIVEHLNSFRVYEYEYGTDLVNGLVVPWRKVEGCDANLDKAIAAAAELPEVAEGSGGYHRASDEGWVRLTDGTLIEWTPAERQWSITIAAQAAAATPAEAAPGAGLETITETNRIRIYDGDRLLATAVRSNGRDTEWIGWQVTTVVNSRGAAFEALRTLAENPRVAQAVTQ